MCTWRLQVLTTFRHQRSSISAIQKTGPNGRDGLRGSKKMQVNTLLYSLGDATDDVLFSFNLSEEDAKNYMIMVRKFEQHFVRRRNVIYDRA